MEASGNYETNGELNKEIEDAEIYEAVQRLKTNKALGLDFIGNEIFKKSGLRVVLRNVFNRLFNTGHVPS